MDPLFFLRDWLSRAFQRKWVPIALFLLFLCSTVCGIAFVKTPAFYDYHLRICDRFLDRVCYSDRSVFVIFLERTAGNALVLFLIYAGSLHPAALILPTSTIFFRAYNFGGTLAILFSVYGMPGALVAFTLYLPIHLLLDTVFLLTAANSFSRAFFFRFCTSDFRELFFELLAILGLIVAICLLEAVLLLALFHPIGNLL